MHGVEGSGSGAVHGGGRRKRGRSQSSLSSDGGCEDLPPREDVPKRMCTGEGEWREREGEDTE